MTWGYASCMLCYGTCAFSHCRLPPLLPQAQDRCHRIGQTREVHIYRLVSERTIEENILTKSDQKRALDHLAIQSGGFNTDFLQRFNPRDLPRPAGCVLLRSYHYVSPVATTLPISSARLQTCPTLSPPGCQNTVHANRLCKDLFLCTRGAGMRVVQTVTSDQDGGTPGKGEGSVDKAVWTGQCGQGEGSA